jgi:hypothetical protein
MSVNFHRQLAKQFRFLEASCRGYDAGNNDEAVRIATCLRILFHDTSHSTSLMHHLGLSNLRLLSSCEGIPANARFWANLTKIVLAPAAAKAEFIAKLDQARVTRLIPFDEWWRNEVVYLVEQTTVSRRDLALAASNKDGGAHVDSQLDDYYEQLLSGAGWKMTLNESTGVIDVPFKHAHSAALRQMAFEVLHSPDLKALEKPSHLA